MAHTALRPERRCDRVSPSQSFNGQQCQCLSGLHNTADSAEAREMEVSNRT